MNQAVLSLCYAAFALSISGCAPDVGSIFSSSSSNPSTGGGGGEGGAGGGGTTTSDGGGTTGTTNSTTKTGGTTTGDTGSTTPTTTTGPCGSDPTEDADADGFTPAQGDCNDCDAEVGPGAIEIAGNAVDENCSGGLDDELPVCDNTVSIDNPFPEEVARAVELCKVASGPNDWGVIGAAWVSPDGSPPPAGNPSQNFHLGHGVVTDFGPNVQPRGGTRLLLLSNGTARRPGDPSYQSPQGFDKMYSSPAPPGFPKETVACPGVVSGEPHDATALSVDVRVPSNAHGFSYDFSFYAYDFPQYVCTEYNDTFFAILSPQLAGLPDGNIAYDELGNPVGLNGANFRVCGCTGGPPCLAGGKVFMCDLGTDQLVGTGFDDNGNRGATGWLTTTVPADPGSEITIRWGVYDASDGLLDATVVLDNWQWITTPGVTQSTEIAD